MPGIILDKSLDSLLGCKTQNHKVFHFRSAHVLGERESDSNYNKLGNDMVCAQETVLCRIHKQGTQSIKQHKGAVAILNLGFRGGLAGGKGCI